MRRKTTIKKKDGRTKKERVKKWIKEQREFGEKFNIQKSVTARGIKMKLAGWDDIAGLDKKGLKAMGYKNTKTMKIRKYLPGKEDYYEVWRKKK